MSDSILTTTILPISLMIIMLGMGLSLIVDDFKRVFEYPKAAFIGFVNQLILLPIIGFALASFFDITPIFAVGVVLIAICPGGVTSGFAQKNLTFKIEQFFVFIKAFELPL